MIKAAERGEAREVALNYSANAGYDVEIGYFLHHKKHKSGWYLGISKMFGWVSRHPICLKLDRGPSSQGRDGLLVSPLTISDQKVLNEFSNKLGTVLSKAFNGKPVKKLKRQTIVFYVRVSCQGQELYYRKVYLYTFDNLNDILKQIPNVRKAFVKDIFLENPS